MKIHTRELRMKDLMHLKDHRSCVRDFRMCEKKAFQRPFQMAWIQLAVQRTGMSASLIRIPFQLIKCFLGFLFSTA